MNRTISLAIVVLAWPLAVFADGHGPVFGLATPTNSAGEWSFDTGVFGRTNDSGSQASFREQIGYGFTPHVSLFVTAPAVFGSASLTPTRIQPGDDFEAKLAWRFQHRATKVGTRFERHSQVWSLRGRNPASGALPTPQTHPAQCLAP